MSSADESKEYCGKEIDRLNEALKQASFQIQMMLKWVNGAVITVDREGDVIEANEIALQDVGWSAEDFIGRQMHAEIHHSQADGSEYPWEFSPIFAAIEDGSSHHVDGDVFWHRDGSNFRVDYIVCPTRDDRNEITGAIVIFRNLTAQKLVEAKRIHGMKLESIGELSAGIAHEINTPIQFIGNNVAFLQEGFNDLLKVLGVYNDLKEVIREQGLHQKELDEIDSLQEEADIEYLREELPKAFDQTQEGVKRVTTLVLGLKGFTHASSSESKQPSDLNEIIDNTLIVCQNAYKYVADLDIELGQVPHIPVLAGDIGQVVLNLVVNAANAIEDKKQEAGERGKITIRSFVDGNDAVITVADTGMGIPAEHQERIFDPFFTTKEVGRGSGQGLAISRTIIHEKHGGHLSFETEEGKDTIFTVRLPIR